MLWIEVLFVFCFLVDVCFLSSNGIFVELVDIVVLIVVGCVLVGLVIIFIIIYFVGRCKKFGY